MQSDEDSRPQPDVILSHIEYENRKKGKGYLKIFLGMAAGVGKTYAMLRAGIDLKNSGSDVIIGLVESHGRKETKALLENFEILARRKINYQNIQLEEFDLELALQRKPKIILVDELAHTNVPQTTHSKRYLDVIDLLNAGIDVFTTVNIQHLESRSDTVKEITGVNIRETVPDSFFDQADEVILIDLSPEELLKRLNEGKIYPENRIDTAEANFFKKGNLTALREMALRQAAERVDRDLRGFKQLHGISEVWKSSNRLLVAIFASPYSETLIRWTRRLADTMDATWIGAYVEKSEPLSDEELSLLARNMHLVKELGGEVISSKDDNIVDGIIRLARQNNVTQIIIGKSLRGIFRNFISGGSIVNRLLRRSNDIDIYCVNPMPNSHNHDSKKIPKSLFQELFPFEELGWMTVIGLLTWTTAAAIESFVGYQTVGILFLVSVCLAGLVLSRVSVLILASLYSLIHNFFFIPPTHSFTVSRPEDATLLISFFIAATIIGHLTARLKRKEKILLDREDMALRQYELSQLLARAQSIQEVASISLQQIRKIMKQDVCIFLANNEHNKITLFQESVFGFTEKEQAVAEWVWQNNRVAGKFTDTLRGCEGFYLPIIGKSHSLGVIGIKLTKKGELSSDELSFIESSANQMAAALEREFHHDTAKKKT